MYRVRSRFGGLNGTVVIIANNLSTLEQAYQVVVKEGAGTNRKFFIDEIEPKLFSKLSAKEAKKRLAELKEESVK